MKAEPWFTNSSYWQFQGLIKHGEPRRRRHKRWPLSTLLMQSQSQRGRDAVMHLRVQLQPQVHNLAQIYNPKSTILRRATSLGAQSCAEPVRDHTPPYFSIYFQYCTAGRHPHTPMVRNPTRSCGLLTVCRHCKHCRGGVRPSSQYDVIFRVGFVHRKPLT
eukprot:365574-Chlamydomonas_euryale.AAC.6